MGINRIGPVIQAVGCTARSAELSTYGRPGRLHDEAVWCPEISLLSWRVLLLRVKEIDALRARPLVRLSKNQTVVQYFTF